MGDLGIMKQKKADLILFSVGATGYGLLEVLWRGYTHWSMLCAGGICFVFFGKISEKLKKSNIFFKALIGSAFVTLIEFIFGIIFNIILKKNVWDYSKLPFNLCGQICLVFSLFWWFLSIAFIPLAEYLKKKISKL